MGHDAIYALMVFTFEAFTISHLDENSIMMSVHVFVSQAPSMDLFYLLRYLSQYMFWLEAQFLDLRCDVVFEKCCIQKLNHFLTGPGVGGKQLLSIPEWSLLAV